jgi:RHH-type proline utilization regulon transcriptional repressor/proline dehydrogenase/delta 1-pyrroline-5-carboxylate dehydrogenase
MPPPPTRPSPFSDFAPAIREQTPLRQAITAAYRRDEPGCIAPLLDQATLPDTIKAAAAATATDLILALRGKHKGTGVEGLVQEYALSSQEGVALMCLAEALLRIPDTATRDALIRDKIADGNWRAHLGGGRSLFVNAATWGLVVTGKLTTSVNDLNLASALTRLIARAGEPVIRRGVDMAMRMMGEQFVTGETIAEALKRSRPLEARGFAFSYDMLGEAAATAADAARYYADYEQAIHAIGAASNGRGIHVGPGISIKLSALHPRYARAQAARVMDELLPRVKALAVLAKAYDIGFNIDAEEADRLELSLDLLEELALDPALAGWAGLGFVVQAYGKRCPFVLDYIIDLARRAQRRIMVRLVKGAYWDAEIKRAQVDGLADFPVYTRKVHTDLAYIACARKLLAATDQVFPQFATHNAQTLATIYRMAGPDFAIGRYEFQCLHGMGEPLYDEVVGKDRLDRPCRVYAPVGTHETLLAYLVRRLLENGANSSFVNRISDPAVPIAELIADPVDTVRAMAVPGQPHDQIALPADLYGTRRNSAGFDLSDETTLAALATALRAGVDIEWHARPTHGAGVEAMPVRNPGDRSDIVGAVADATPDVLRAACARAAAAVASWSARAPGDRAALLERAGEIMQQRMPTLLGLIMREAGKTLPNAIGEVREAIDFLRYYAAEARRTLAADTAPLGPVACISPWNFPLAIFTGQIAAALAAGNPVLAKPAEETPLIAAEAVRILHEAGIAEDVLQLLPGDGGIGGALVAEPAIAAVLFTGSTDVARLIQKQLARRLSPAGKPIPLIAETGGQNAMIVDSSALAEQVVADVLASAFDSAGQRCSALRVLCLQDEVADRILAMLKGALHELSIGSTDRLSVDVGPVITAEARDMIERHVAAMRRSGHAVEQIARAGETGSDSFVPPTIIELRHLRDLEREVFGPVLHVIRYPRAGLDQLIDDINTTGYGLTFGLHTRLDETIAQVTGRVKAGNLYINRNIIGAVVGVQPFGGRGLSGTGPKAGGPLYLGRLVADPSRLPDGGSGTTDPALLDYAHWLESLGADADAEAAHLAGRRSALGRQAILPGPVGETNIYALHPRGRVLLLPQTERGLRMQLAAVLATGNDAVIQAERSVRDTLSGAPAPVLDRIEWIDDVLQADLCAAALIEGAADRILLAQQRIAAMDGPILLMQASDGRRDDGGDYCLDWLLEEVSTSINTTAAGGNASLMTIA